MRLLGFQPSLPAIVLVLATNCTSNNLLHCVLASLPYAWPGSDSPSAAYTGCSASGLIPARVQASEKGGGVRKMHNGHRFHPRM